MSNANMTPIVEEDIPNLTLGDIIQNTTARGLPQAKFLDSVETFATSFDPPASSELLIGAYSELYQRYKGMEMSLDNKVSRLQQKIPELEKSLQLLKQLGSREAPTSIRYSLADNIYAQALVEEPSTVTVNLWLGANVMLEYTQEEAIAFLEGNLNKAKVDLEHLEEDLAFVRDQIVTTEVTSSRIFNWDVRRRRQGQQGRA